MTGHLQVIMTSMQTNNPAFKKATSLRNSKFILLGDSIVNIRSCMTSDYPTQTLHPILGTASAHLARENRYHAIYSCQNCQHTTLLVYSPPILSTNYSCKHGITKSGSATLVTWPAHETNSFPRRSVLEYAKSQHVMNKHFPKIIFAADLNKLHLMYSA